MAKPTPKQRKKKEEQEKKKDRKLVRCDSCRHCGELENGIHICPITKTVTFAYEDKICIYHEGTHFA